MDDAAYLRAQQALPSSSASDAVQLFGSLVDAADMRHDRAVLKQLSMQAPRVRATLDSLPRDIRALEFHWGNTLSLLHAIESQPDSVWTWDQPHLRDAIYHYRRSLSYVVARSAGRALRVKSLVNLANALSHVGRSFDAIEQYDRAIELCPRFAMAIGNRGFAIMHLTRWLYDPSHRFLAMRQAWEDMQNAMMMPKTLEPHATSVFQQAITQIESCFGLDKLRTKLECPAAPVGLTDDERAYRAWSHQHRLFVNDIADFIPASVSATDPTSLPAIVSPTRPLEQFYGLYNLMKQEFVTARWLCYSGLHSRHTHFADRKVLIYNTLDYPCHSIAMDQVRIGLRAAFSVLDKIGLFINAYWKLGHAPSQVNFRLVWYVKRDRKKGLLPAIQHLRNWPLRGIYWLSLDLADKDHQETLEPESRSLQELRHKLEHQFVKVVEPLSSTLNPITSPTKVFTDPRIVMYVSRPELEAKAIRVLQLVRRALLQLSMAVQAEEEARAKARGNVAIGQIKMPVYSDDWKR